MDKKKASHEHMPIRLGLSALPAQRRGDEAMQTMQLGLVQITVLFLEKSRVRLLAEGIEGRESRGGEELERCTANARTSRPSTVAWLLAMPV